MAKTQVWTVTFPNAADQEKTVYSVAGDFGEAMRKVWKLDELHPDHANRYQADVHQVVQVDISVDEVPVDVEADLKARLDAVEQKVSDLSKAAPAATPPSK